MLGVVRQPAQPVEQRPAVVLVHTLEMADEDPVDVQVPAARGRMRGHHGMTHGRELLLHPGQPLRRYVPAEGVREIVDGIEVFDQILGLAVERVVGGVHVGEQRVAAERGCAHRMKDRGPGRVRPPGDVVVPLILVSTDGGALLEARQFGFVDVARDDGMGLQLAEPPREGDLRRRGQRLIAEEDHLVVV
jgi:hypothetical protein